MSRPPSETYSGYLQILEIELRTRQLFLVQTSTQMYKIEHITSLSLRGAQPVMFNVEDGRVPSKNGRFQFVTHD